MTDTPPCGIRLDLSATERTEIATLAAGVTTDPSRPAGVPGALDHTRLLGCHLPARVRDALRQYRSDPGEEGVLVIGNLPIAPDDLPPTPGDRDSVEHTVTTPVALLLTIGQQLGELISYRDEKSGALVQNVVPVRGLDTSQSNAGSVAMELHTENAFHQQRPDYVGLLCLRPDRDGNAGTLVSCTRRALHRLSTTDLAVLGEPRFVTEPPPSFRSGAATAAHPVLDSDTEDPNIRVDFNATHGLDDDATAVLHRLRKVLADTAVPVVLSTGDLVFVDNRITVHGRAPFAPRYDGRDRWLQRIFVHLDNRRSRAFRAGNGPVLT